tara:strand:- start:21 stop:446 length:426 start_codon:yes stop_codon:yes gene_type:complete
MAEVAPDLNAADADAAAPTQPDALRDALDAFRAERDRDKAKTKAAEVELNVLTSHALVHEAKWRLKTEHHNARCHTQIDIDADNNYPRFSSDPEKEERDVYCMEGFHTVPKTRRRPRTWIFDQLMQPVQDFRAQWATSERS